MNAVPTATVETPGRKMSKAELPRRPMNAFMLFRRDSPEVQRAMSNDTKKYSQSGQSSLAGELWQAMSDAERSPWTRAAEEVKREHRLKYPDYCYRPKRLKHSKSQSLTKGSAAERRGSEASGIKVRVVQRDTNTTPKPDTRGIQTHLRTSANASALGPVLSPNQPPDIPSVHIYEYDAIGAYAYLESPLRTDPLHMRIPIKLPQDAQPATPPDDFDYSEYLHDLDDRSTEPLADTCTHSDIRTLQQFSFPMGRQPLGDPVLASSYLVSPDDLHGVPASRHQTLKEMIYRQSATSAGALNASNYRGIKLSANLFNELYPLDRETQENSQKYMDSDSPYYGVELQRETLLDLESWFQTGSDEQYGM